MARPKTIDPAVDDSNRSSLEIIDALAYYCEAADLKSFKPAVSKVTKLVCHYKACAELPRLASNADAPPGFEYALSADGTTLDKSLCETAGRGMSHNNARVWIKKSF